MSQMQPPVYPSTYAGLKPHRGTAVLVLGILSIVIGCAGWILGIIAWVMANGDLAEMASGQMDPSGRGLTQAGKVLGMVSVILHLAALAVWVIILILGGGIAVWGASTGH